ncbi:uncharacterized protein K460DRAFT_342798 [Cucurbitaria berberidis CBS 394.84]|uniref:Microbial-type PARG catalytic domain-containing protein n=1 Tax=Cucurbitaria berberidis CBS 394.84 TaxID=1168544 RepID=A0A9P4GEB0_9PLEO|nr:uncharacterized protein K460DRAFT_342798 [Cucurbitaria berberidis CBS 394.84]KAF1843975.1 hypothetical protein K460DRAFT_342798 [Cucurbitaria berberidis CBS 394.84]
MQQGSILPFLQKAKSSRPDTSRPGQPYHPRPNSNKSKFKPSSTGPHRGPNRRRNMHLKEVADETKVELPKILSAISSLNAAESYVYDLKDLGALSANDCPGFLLPFGDADAGKKGTRIRVYDMDTFDVALQLEPTYKVCTHLGMPNPIVPTTSTDHAPMDEDSIDYVATARGLESTFAKRTATPMTFRGRTARPVAVLNLASERSPGGGWQNGALAQEECLCYRSSLYLSLHKSYYPLPSLSAIYTPSVVLIRDAMSRGHTLLTPFEVPANLPVTSVISIAALRKPQLSEGDKTFKNIGQRAETKRKIRITLRVAAHKGHTKLVLGALGCGVFANPPKEVAECFLEVLRENEFQGGWWEEVGFAVLDNVKGPHGGKDGEGNFGIFHRVLDGQLV